MDKSIGTRNHKRRTWKQVYHQFGLHPAKASDKRTVQNFRSEVLRELKKIKIAWPDLNYSTASGVLILHPSTPAIPRWRDRSAVLSAIPTKQVDQRAFGFDFGGLSYRCKELRPERLQ